MTDSATPTAPAEIPANSGQRGLTLRSRLARASRSLSTVAIFAGLAGAAWWGHATGWTFPSAPAGAALDQTDDWCQAHSVPESRCIECNAKLTRPGADYGWCKRHGVAQCPLDHPDVAQLKQTPAIDPEDFERAARALALRPRVENNSRCKLYARRVQFASAEALEMAGVDIAIVARRRMVESIVANGELVYDETRTAQLSSRVAGSAALVERQAGDQVAAGDVLALVDSAEIGRAKSELLQALVQQRLKRTNLQRLRPLVENGSIPERAFREAETALEEAEIRLLTAQQALENLGLPAPVDEFDHLDARAISQRMRYLALPPDLAARMEKVSATSNLYPLRSPLEGVVVSRRLVAGETVEVGQTLFSVSDVRRMWLLVDVRQEDTPYLAMGQTVLFRPTDRRDDREIRGAVSWISTAADDRTRSLKLRVEVPNPDGRLRANTFGMGRIVLRDEPAAIVVPTEAVHSDGDCHVVFVRDKDFLKPDSPKFFHVRNVRIGVQEGGMTEIIVGVLPGEVIASKNSALLEAQLLKSNLGAGCGCCAH